ncbi:protein transport protein SEC20, putative (SEC20), partial [Plasmodium ovale curtisi]
MHKISPLLNRMKFVDDNLKKLFLSENVLTDHDSYLLFRGRVSKRIEDYAHLISQCNGKILECENWEEDTEEYVRQKMEQHRRNIENHKRELSVWWATNGRDYHRLCMSHFLNNRKSCVTTEHGDNNRADANLKDTKKMMIDEINRMKNVRSELIESSQMLRKQNEIFKAFESKLRYSAQLIFSLKKRYQFVEKRNAR